MKKNLTIYLPNGDTDVYRQGDEDVKDIMLLNNGVIAIVFDSGEERIFANMPFVFDH